MELECEVLFDLPSKVLAIRLQDVAVVVELVELLLDEGEPGRDHHKIYLKMSR